MKMGINRIQKCLLLVIGILAIILAGVLSYKGYSRWQDKKQEEEWAKRHDETQLEIDSVRMQIQELAYDTEALQAFLDENMQQEVVVFEETTREAKEEQQEVMSDAIESETENPAEVELHNSVENPAETEAQSETEFSGDAIIIDAPPEINAQATPPETISGNDMEAEEDTAAELETISGNGMAAEADTIAEPETISGNGMAAEADTAAEPKTISGNAIVDGQVIPYQPVERELTLEEKRNIRSSYAETMQVNGEDKAIISQSQFDFSGMKIACLGDSITEGSNMDALENYKQYSYPSVLKNILNAEEVYNLGIGGSSYGRYWDHAFVDRYKEIPQDVDLILVMGGTNDGFAASSQELGSLEKKEARTYYGDVNELMQGLKADYPNAKIIFITPLPNILHDYLLNQRDYLLPQSVFADAVKELAAENEIEVIDLYNSNILDTHDAQIISTYMLDGVHCNPAGYQILAEHIASGVIQIMEQDLTEKNMVSGNVAEKTVSENALEDTVSENALEDTVSENALGDTVSENALEDAVSENEMQEERYEYGGEAIIIQ